MHCYFVDGKRLFVGPQLKGTGGQNSYRRVLKSVVTSIYPTDGGQGNRISQTSLSTCLRAHDADHEVSSARYREGGWTRCGCWMPTGGYL